jgi:hypothetical protein
MTKFLLILFILPLIGFSQNDTVYDPFGPRVLDGVYIPKKIHFKNPCFKEPHLFKMWVDMQFKSFGDLKNESFDFESANACPELEVELIGKELDSLNGTFYDSDKKITSPRINQLTSNLIRLSEDPSAKVRAKSFYLLAHWAIIYPEENQEIKTDYLIRYVQELDSIPSLLNYGEYNGLSLYDYRSTLAELAISCKKLGLIPESKKYYLRYKDSYVKPELEDDFLLLASYYYAISGMRDSSEYYCDKIKVVRDEDKFYHTSTGYFNSKMINLLNNHFDPKKLLKKTPTYAYKDSTGKETKNSFYIKFSEPFFYPIGKISKDKSSDYYWLIKNKDGKNTSIYEANVLLSSAFLFEGKKLTRFVYYSPFITRLEPSSRFAVVYDKQNLVRQITVWIGDSYLSAEYDKYNISKWEFDGVEIHETKGFPLLKKYLIREGFKNWFRYNIPEGYESLIKEK